MKQLFVVVALGLLACPSKETPRAAAAPPAAPSAKDKSLRSPPSRFDPLERVTVGDPDAGADDARMAFFRVAPFEARGTAVPEGAVRVELNGDAAMVSGVSFDVLASRPEVPVLLAPDAETYLAQAAPLLAKLDDAHRQVWLAHPDKPLAFKVTLRDEKAFEAWIDDATPGKLRIIHRADGFELQTNMGKLPGVDPNGPSVPVRGGSMDLATLYRGLERIQTRFKGAPDVCFVPSFGMPLADTTRAMSADYISAERAHFPELCLVYPRPVARDAGK